MQTERLYCVCTDFYIVVENVNAVLRCFRIHVAAAAQLLDGAHHTVGLNAS